MLKPYIGVSGFMSRDEVVAALAVFPPSERLLMVGVLASSKTLCGIPNRYPLRYPKAEDIAGIFVDDPRCLNLVHVSTDSAPSSVDGKLIPVEIDMARAFRAGGPLCHGVQLNNATSRLTSAALSAFRGLCPTASRVVLQVGPTWIANRSFGRSLSESLLMYAGKVTDILIDGSGGRGRMIDPAQAAATIRYARDGLRHFGVPEHEIPRFGFAGGLCGPTLPQVAKLLREDPSLSFDAEGRLRDGIDGGGNMLLSRVEDYLRVACALTQTSTVAIPNVDG